jgi:hypothetical protein
MRDVNAPRTIAIAAPPGFSKTGLLIRCLIGIAAQGSSSWTTSSRCVGAFQAMPALWPKYDGCSKEIPTKLPAG